MHERRGESDEWYTPKYIFDTLGVIFDLDVSAPHGGPRHVPCEDFISSESLSKDWYGFVWMNPPFGNQDNKILWLEKFFLHGNGVALMPDRTSSKWWQQFAPMADLVMFTNHKIKFEREDGSIGDQPSTGTTLLAVGPRGCDALGNASNLGLTFKASR